MTTDTRVGGEVDAFCTKCELLLAHTVLAMVGPKVARVRCNTCKAEHAYRGAVVPKSTKPKKKRVAAAEKIIIAFEDRLKSHDLTKARKYSPKESFAPEEVMEHPTFGFGIVTAVRNDKVDVAFKAFEKTLLHQRSDGLANKPTFSTTAPKPRATEAVDPMSSGAAPPADGTTPS